MQTLRNADEQRKLILENKALLGRLTEANRIKAEFINGMSHEVRTPLGHITGFAQILEDTLENLTEKQVRYVQNIQNGAKRLLDLFENILSFSTLKTGDVHVNPESVNIGEVVGSAIDESRPLAADQGITVSVSGDSSAKAYVDPIICGRAINLLLDNAIKFNKEGGSVVIDVSITDTLAEDIETPDTGGASGWLSISLADTGIAEDQYEQIFGLFTQADGSLSRAYEGAGIGLALARSLARLHGGAITLRSQPDQGSTFTLILPITDEPSS
jgi:signal transduction histidine kinase